MRLSRQYRREGAPDPACVEADLSRAQILTKAIGLDFDGSGFGLGIRSKRYAMLVDNGVVKTLNIEESPGVMEVSGADRILAAL